MPIAYDDRYVLRPGHQVEFTREMVMELQKCAVDIIYFSENYYTIVHPTKGKMVISLYDFQKELLSVFNSGKRSIICSGRQLGKTTCSCIYLLWYSIFNADKDIAILANKQSTAASIVSDIKEAYEQLPPWMKPGVKKYDNLTIIFDNGTKVYARATSPDALRGESVSLMFLDEFAFVPENIAEDFWASQLPTLSCLSGDTLLLTKDGFKEIKDFIPNNSKVGDYIPIYDLEVWGKEGIERASHFYNSPKSKTNKIITQYGLTHESTLDHPIYSLSDTHFGMLPSSQLNVGDFVRVDFGMNVYGDNTNINYHDNGYYNNCKKYNLNIDIFNKDHSYMIGGYIAEGWCSDKLNVVYICNTDKEFRSIFMNSEFNFKVISNQNHKLYSTQETYRFFKYIIGETNLKCHEKVVPKFILQTTKENQMAFIAGYIDGDGHVTKKGDISCCSTSKKLLLQIQQMLLNMGIVSHVYENKIDKTKLIGKYILQQGNKLKTLKDNFTLKISRVFSKNILKFGLRIPRKLKRLEQCKEQNEEISKQFKIPLTDIIHTEIVKCYEKSGYTQEYFRNNGVRLDEVIPRTCNCISRYWVVSFCKIVSTSDILNEISRTNCFFDRIISKEGNVNTTYDLTCPKTHSFLQNGILGSNTGGSVIIVSTPNGTAGLFYKLWKQSEKRDSGWNNLKITWDRHPDRDEDWKEQTIKDLGSKIQFAKEHACSFTGSSYTLIDGDVLEKIQAKEPTYYTEEGYYSWKKPEPGHLYMAGVDVAKGANSDYHVINIYDVTNFFKNGRYEQVAIYRRNDISVFDFKDKVVEIAKIWNDAVVIVENNDLGHVVVQNIYFEDGYENTWYDYDKGEYGVRSSPKTKPLAISYFKEDIESGNQIVNSQDMITELGYYEEIRTGIFGARNGREFHDDTVSSGYWVSFGLRSRWFEDYYDWWLKNNNPNHEKLMEYAERENEKADAEVADSFLKSFGLGSDIDKEMEDFRRGLSF